MIYIFFKNVCKNDNGGYDKKSDNEYHQLQLVAIAFFIARYFGIREKKPKKKKKKKKKIKKNLSKILPLW